MSMSDCPKCWNTPCTCGYMGYTVTRIPGKSQYDLDKEADALRDENRRLTARIEALERASNSTTRLQKPQEGG